MDSNEQQNKIKQKVEENQLRSSPLTTSFPPSPSPPSSTSSPSHEFSFTVSLQQQQHHHHQNHSSNNYANTKPLQTNSKIINSNSNNNTFAIDLSPADDIFFHGHLLPLHLLSHLPPVSPRSSTNSVENFTLPVKDLIDDHRNEKSYSDSNILHKKINTTHDQNNETKGRAKAKSFSIFGLPRWKRGGDGDAGGYGVREGDDKDNKNKKKPRFDVNQVLKRYLRMVRPLLSSFRGIRSRERNRRFDREEYNSFSGNSSFRDKKSSHEFTMGRRRGQYSAPASIRTSPTNSGLLIATPTTSITSSTSDSTMEELQAAIQAAIAHCKNSFAVDDKIKCKD